MHQDILILGWHFGKVSKGHFLELGIFTGGLSLMVAQGMSQSVNSERRISVHADVAPYSLDTTRARLNALKSRSKTNVIFSRFKEPGAASNISAILGGGGVDLMVIDNDGTSHCDLLQYL